MSDTRKIAIKSLQKILEQKLFLSDIREDFPDLSRPDSTFLNMLLLTTLRHLTYIRKIIKTYSGKKIPNKHLLAEYAIILAIAEILYLQTPEYATINSYVDIIKHKINKFVGGFANAVLRKVASNKDMLIKDDEGEFFPPSFLEILKLDYDTTTIKQIEQAAIKEPPLDITVKSNPEKWAQILSGTELPNGSIRLNKKTDITTLTGFAEGEWWVQDFAASLATQTINNPKNLQTLDLCAAPGGKSAQLINSGANVTCLDISSHRLETLRQNLSRLKLEPEQIIQADGIEYLKNFTGDPFDIILLDAPCSATGTIRRHPEIVHIKTIDDILKQTELQKQFLTHVEAALKPGGILVYCTCSISKLEGEHQIDNFLKEHKNFVLIKQKETNLWHNNGIIRTLPFHLKELGGMDSFFIAVLQKAE